LLFSFSNHPLDSRWSPPAILILTLLAVLAGTNAHAQLLPQAKDARVARMKYSNSSGEEGLTIYHYRRDGILQTEVWMLSDHSRHSANFYQFDSSGFAVEKYREFSDGLTSTENFENDDTGRRLKETFSRSDGISGTAQFQWNDEGLLIATDCDKYKGWFSGRIDYRYEGEKLTGAAITRQEQVIGHIDYTYNHAGHLIREFWDFGGQWDQTFAYEYEPVPHRLFAASSPLMNRNTRFRVTSESYDFNQEKSGPSVYEYDSTGKLQNKIFTRDDGLTTETTYTFDQAGNLETSHRVYHDGQTADFSYTFDDALRMTGKKFRRSDGQEGFESYSYDHLGRLAKADFQNVDFWLNGTIEFSYDNWGYPEAGHFAGKDGYDAELAIETDANGNVLTVHWIFSFGKTQTYNFKYGPAFSMVPATDPGNHPALVKALDQSATPLPSGDPLLWKDEDLQWLDKYGTAKILALGEATHGTREFTTARQRLFRYLVEHHGFRVLAVEAHFTECLHLDRCLNDSSCDLNETMGDRMLIWTTKSREMLELFQWIRQHNQGKPEAEWIHYVGYDSQVRNQIEELLHDLLKDSDPGLSAEIDRFFLPLSDLNRAAYQEMTDETLATHREQLLDLRKRLARKDVQDNLGHFDGLCVLQLVDAAYQSLEFLQQYFHHGKLVRDRHLTENVLWTAGLFGEDTKVMLWAHNAHVAVHEGYAPDAGGGMGWQLRQKLGDDYQSLALVFSRGEFRAKVFDKAGDVTSEPRNVVFVVDPPDGSLNRLLEAAEAGSFFLDFDRIAPSSDLGNWLAGERPILGVGDLFLGYEKIPEYHYGGDRIMSPTGAFDALVFLADTHATEKLAKIPE
jgi:erythromycin esterase